MSTPMYKSLAEGDDVLDCGCRTIWEPTWRSSLPVGIHRTGKELGQVVQDVGMFCIISASSEGLETTIRVPMLISMLDVGSEEPGFVEAMTNENIAALRDQTDFQIHLANLFLRACHISPAELPLRMCTRLHGLRDV